MSNELLFKAAYFIQNHQSFDNWAYPGYGQKKHSPVRIEDMTVLVVDTIEDSRDRDSHYGEYMQGSTSPAGIRFKVEFDSGDVIYLQKDGEYDSYGEVSYSGKLREVKPVAKTVTIYEFA